MLKKRMFRQVSNSWDTGCSYQNKLDGVPEIIVEGRQKGAACITDEQQVSDVSKTSVKSISHFP